MSKLIYSIVGFFFVGLIIGMIIVYASSNYCGNGRKLYKCDNNDASICIKPGEQYNNMCNPNKKVNSTPYNCIDEAFAEGDCTREDNGYPCKDSSKIRKGTKCGMGIRGLCGCGPDETIEQCIKSNCPSQ